MTNTVKISTGSVRKVYTPTGKRLTQLEHFKDGGKYICCGAEKIDTERSKIFNLDYIYSILTFRNH